MANSLRRFFEGTAGQITAIVAIVVGVTVCIWSIRANLGSDLVDLSKSRRYVDSRTGQSFVLSISDVTPPPVKSPYTGEKTGYPAEACYWTKDGKIKSDPTYVLLKQYMNLPGPTFCPDCGRLVVPGNPAPLPGQRPPPTEAEYSASPRRGGAAQ
jgi:hypothetical protein